MANEIHKIREAVEAQLMKVDKVIASNEAIAEELTNIEAELAHGFSEISKGIQDLCCITYHGFHEIIDRLHFQSEMLEEIKEILKRPLDTQAKELRERGERAYLNNWFNEAEQDLLEAEKKNYQDFIVRQILGNIYYFHKSNYKKALEYYQKAAKYATPVSKRDASNAFLSAAMVYYRLNQLSDAHNSAKAALELMPDDPHFLYHYARYVAKNGYMNEFLNKLRECIYKDPKYLIMADVDEMFYDVKEEITKLAKYLRDEKKQAVDNLSKEILSVEAEAKTIGIKELPPSLKEQRTEITKLSARNSYLDFLKAEEIAKNVYGKILLLIRDKLLKKEEKEIGKEFNKILFSCGMCYVISVLTLIIVNAITGPEFFDGDFGFVVSLLIAPVMVAFGGILSILHIFGVDIEGVTLTPTLDILFLSAIILIIFWLVLVNKRLSNRLKDVRKKLKEIEERMPKGITPAEP